MKSFHERFPEVPSDEAVILELYCSFNENGSKNRGRLYITPRRIAFYPIMGDSKKIILLENIQDIQKSKGFISTGIDLILTQGSIISLGEILKRESVYHEIVKVKTDIQSSSWWRLFG